MKIAIVSDAIYPFTLGGSEIRNYEIAKRLVKKGHEVHIYGGRFWNGGKNIELEGISIHGVSDYKKLNYNQKRRDSFESLKLSAFLFFELIKEDFDIIDNLSFNFFNCYVTKIVSVLKKIPLVFTWQQYFGNYLEGYLGLFRGSIARVLELFSTKLAEFNIASSYSVRNQLTERKVRIKNVRVIYNGVDLNAIGRHKKQDKVYDLIFVGRLTYQKNIELLIRSLDLVKKRIPKIKLCIIGDGEERKELEKLVRNLDLKDNVDFIGEIKDRKRVVSYMKLSKILILTSRLEGFPLALVEANACGLPAIITSGKWNKNEPYTEENTFIVKNNKNDVSESIIKLAKDEQLRKRMGREGIKKTRELGWDEITDETEDYYKEVIEYSRIKWHF